MKDQSISENQQTDLFPIKFQLDSGIEVRLDRFHLKLTYGSLLEGNPHDELISEYIIEGLEEFSGFGDGKKIYMIPLKKGDKKAPLPPFSCFAELTSFTATKDFEASGSRLIVHWFETSFSKKLLSEIIYQAVRKIDWNKESYDFYSF